MRLLFISVLFFNSWLALAQPKYSIEFLNKIGEYNVSHLWTAERLYIKNEERIIDRPEPLGYIGENYQRFYIHFISVKKSTKNNLQYLVKGKTLVNGNKCNFQGTIKISEARTTQGSKTNKGYLKGSYEFLEDPSEKGAGILKGKFQTNFYIDAKGQLQYDALDFNSDSYKNNQFEGVWKSYKTGYLKKCNWGDFRIPDSDSLDIGAGEFSVSDKYVKNDWISYMIEHMVPYSSLKPERRNDSLVNKKWWEDKKTNDTPTKAKKH